MTPPQLWRTRRQRYRLLAVQCPTCAKLSLQGQAGCSHQDAFALTGTAAQSHAPEPAYWRLTDLPVWLEQPAVMGG